MSDYGWGEPGEFQRFTRQDSEPMWVPLHVGQIFYSHSPRWRNAITRRKWRSRPMRRLAHRLGCGCGRWNP